MPERIQRRRTRGYRFPEGAVYVGRPTEYGNPWPIDGPMQPWLALALGFRDDEEGRRASAVAAFAWWIRSDGSPFPVKAETPVPGDLIYSEMPAAMGVLMLGRGGPIVLPKPPALAPLRGRDLVCWCPRNQPCHGDVLLALANDQRVHACPPKNSGIMPCCGQPPLERLVDRLTTYPFLVTCRG